MKRGSMPTKRKRKTRKLNKKYYVADDYGHTDEMLVGKINELIDILEDYEDRIRALERRNQ